MELNQLVATAIEALEDVKARDIKIFNTEKLTDQFERVIIASGSSNRQTRALAYAVSSAVKEAGGEVLGIEGGDTGEWVLVDLGTVVVHVLQPNVRDYYNLEEIWGGKEVFLEAQKSECAPHLMPHRAEKQA
ncbi:ribosome silencing factor [Sutterella seckii]|mgnify:FL=1|uniref:Ribosomal silencing factor RsfS n=1 Tax=Sutterella seckii TaxID=1944635 RepID=A0A6I1EZG6_9BURK|nr:ribosome silencing factor [Sutterella seckii]KAB7663110.1 ribosome silencing factor [Sutterella seckii]MBS5216654.1 ribosome silencing factor [Sutterella wadsworthensis]